MTRLLPVKPFHQSKGYCGPACLKMVLEYYGVKKTERDLARLSGCTRDWGVDAKGLVRAARTLGMQTTVKERATLDDLARFVRKRTPVIVNWFSETDGHYSVVVGVNRTSVTLQDPEIGKLRRLPKKTFNRVWFSCAHDWFRSTKDLIIRRLIVIRPKKHATVPVRHR